MSVVKHYGMVDNRTAFNPEDKSTRSEDMVVVGKIILYLTKMVIQSG